MAHVRMTPKAWNWTKDFVKTRKCKESRRGMAFRIARAGHTVPQDRPRPIRKSLTVVLTLIVWVITPFLAAVVFHVIPSLPRFLLGCGLAVWFLVGIIPSAEFSDRLITMRDRAKVRARLRERRAARKAKSMVEASS